MQGKAAAFALRLRFFTSQYSAPACAVNHADDSRSTFGFNRGVDRRKLRRWFLLAEFLGVDAVLGAASGVLVTQERRAADEVDGQVIQISGIVRPSDVAFDNTIPSEKVANFQITMKIRGPEHQFNTPGWFGRLLNWLSPS